MDKTPFENAGKWFWNIFKNLWKGVKGCFNLQKGFLLRRYEMDKNPFENAGKWFWNIFANLWKGVKGCFNGVKDFFAKVWGWITAPFVNAWLNGLQLLLIKSRMRFAEYGLELWTLLQNLNSIKSFSICFRLQV